MVFARVGVKAKITEAKFLEEAMKMVLKKRNKLVNRLKLNSLVHGGADAITSFVTRLKPQARTGKFKEKCEACREAADYTDQMVLDNPIRGLANDDIKKKVLAMLRLDARSNILILPGGIRKPMYLLFPRNICISLGC